MSESRLAGNPGAVPGGEGLGVERFQAIAIERCQNAGR